jgi:hypothetical protein
LKKDSIDVFFHFKTTFCVIVLTPEKKWNYSCIGKGLNKLRLTNTIEHPFFFIATMLQKHTVNGINMAFTHKNMEFYLKKWSVTIGYTTTNHFYLRQFGCAPERFILYSRWHYDKKYSKDCRLKFIVKIKIFTNSFSN